MMDLANNLLAWIHWDPPRFAFTVPIINRPVAWYGIFFAFGFILGFILILRLFNHKLLQSKKLLERDIAKWPLLITHLKKGIKCPETPLGYLFSKLSSEAKQNILDFKLSQEPDQHLKNEILRVINSCMIDVQFQLDRKQIESLFPAAIYTSHDLASYLTDRITWFVVCGTIIGSRLGHVFFYEWPRYQNNLLDIFKIWEGGLASHGGTIGIMTALFFYLKMIRNRFPEFSYVDILDFLAIPTAMAAVWIRIGNFFNQEILGPVTTVPWAIVFRHPYDGASPLPRHPAQLYEAAAYLAVFVLLFTLWTIFHERLKRGTLIGTFMITIFGSRFFIEFLKDPQSIMIDESFLSTGQYLSIPFILLGVIFLMSPNFATLTAIRRRKEIAG